MEFYTVSARGVDEDTANFLGIQERVVMWTAGGQLNLAAKCRFGLVLSGPSRLETSHGLSAELPSGCFFSTTGAIKISNGAGVLIESDASNPMEIMGGPVEQRGRLRYIDGCTDTLLLSPPRLGDACLNALFFPKNIHQTTHTHPSARIGAVLSGKGVCRTPSGQVTLYPGLVFVIPPGASHAFSTSDSEMVVVAFHPDSDFGPKDEDHPMINRTMVNGCSANLIDSIRTVS